MNRIDIEAVDEEINNARDRGIAACIQEVHRIASDEYAGQENDKFLWFNGSLGGHISNLLWNTANRLSLLMRPHNVVDFPAPAKEDEEQDWAMVAAHKIMCNRREPRWPAMAWIIRREATEHFQPLLDAKDAQLAAANDARKKAEAERDEAVKALRRQASLMKHLDSSVRFGAIANTIDGEIESLSKDSPTAARQQ